jgi:hypothetical protein
MPIFDYFPNIKDHNISHYKFLHRQAILPVIVLSVIVVSIASPPRYRYQHQNFTFYDEG